MCIYKSNYVSYNLYIHLKKASDAYIKSYISIKILNNFIIFKIILLFYRHNLYDKTNKTNVIIQVL